MVTGANRGIGRGVVRRLAERGVTTVLGARDRRRGEEAARGMAGAVVVRPLDVTDPDSVEALAEWIRVEHGGLDVLVNNAGVDYDTWQTSADADLAVVAEALAVNVVGAWPSAVALAPLLRRGGRLVNVSSGAGSFAETGGAAGAPGYSVSKAAGNMLTVKPAVDLRRQAVLVNAVCPGWVATDMGGPGGVPSGKGRPACCSPSTCPTMGRTLLLSRRSAHPLVIRAQERKLP